MSVIVELKNQEFIEKEKAIGHDLYQDELGRIRIKLGFREYP